MSFLDWNGLILYDKKIKKYIESKLTDAGLSRDEIDNILNDYASKTYVTDEIVKAVSGGTVDLTGYAKKTDINMTLEEANNKLNEVLGTSDVKYFE